MLFRSGLCGRCTGVAVPLRVVPSPPGLPSKRDPGLGSLSRADRGIGGVRNVAPPIPFYSVNPRFAFCICESVSCDSIIILKLIFIMNY